MFGPLIVVMTSGRSGSSLVCGLLEKHGIWTGPTREGDWRNPDGFFENMDVYRACDHYGQFKDEQGIAKNDGKWENKFKEIIEKQGYRSGPLLIKHIPNCFPIWWPMKPIWVTVRRDIEDQIKSRKRIKKSLSRKGIEGRERWLDVLENHMGAYRVDTEKLINGEYGQLNKAIHAAGLIPNKKIFKNMINKEYWHYGQNE